MENHQDSMDHIRQIGRERIDGKISRVPVGGEIALVIVEAYNLVTGGLGQEKIAPNELESRHPKHQRENEGKGVKVVGAPRRGFP